MAMEMSRGMQYSLVIVYQAHLYKVWGDLCSSHRGEEDLQALVRGYRAVGVPFPTCIVILVDNLLFPFFPALHVDTIEGGSGMTMRGPLLVPRLNLHPPLPI